MGISGTKMSVHSGMNEPKSWEHCELMCFLPADWDMPGAVGPGAQEKWSWPFNLLRAAGKYVSSTKAWVAYGHTLPNFNGEEGDEPLCPGSKLTGFLLVQPSMERPGFERLRLPDERIINLYLVVPITTAEAAWKVHAGADRSLNLITGFKNENEHAVIDYIIDSFRPCAVESLGSSTGSVLTAAELQQFLSFRAMLQGDSEDPQNETAEDIGVD